MCKESGIGASPAVQWLRLRTSTAGGKSLIPGQGTKIPHVMWCSQKRIEISLLREKRENILSQSWLFLDREKIRDKLIWIQKVMGGLWKRNLKERVLHGVKMGSY